MKKALSYLVNRNLARGWSGWLEMWAERLAKLESFAAAWPSSFIVNLLAAGLRGSSPWRHVMIRWPRR